MPAISATLITFNEERDLPQALASLAGIVDEIVVVDSNSSDRTREIARQSGARVLSRSFSNFADQKNFAVAQAAHDWVLVLDADEALSEELRDALFAWKQSKPDCVAYRVARKTEYLGAWIRHSGWYPDYTVRLLQRNHAHYVGAIHESAVADGAIGLLAGDLFHYSFRSSAEYDAKVEVFTTLVAEDLYAHGRRRWRLGFWLAPLWTVLHTFVLQAGFLDGYRGALIAWNGARYVRMKYRKLGRLVRGGELPHREWPQAGKA